MKRLLAGGLVLGFAGAGFVAFATPGGAQTSEPPEEVVQLEATVSPSVAGPGAQVTVTPDQPCTLEGEGPGVLAWFWEIDADVEEPVQGEHFDEGEVPLGEDGSWEVTFTSSSLNGDYFFVGLCFPNGVEGDEEEQAACELQSQTATLTEEPEPPAEEPPFDCLFEFYEETFTVEGGTSPTTPPGSEPPVAPPASPIPSEPSFTG